MKTPKLYFGALALICTIALVIGTAGAAAGSDPDSNCFGNKTVHEGGPVKMLDRLEERGIDVSAIRVAVESGDMNIVHTLMQQFKETYKDLMPGRNATERNKPGFGPGMMENRLAQLEAKGYDVSAISTAVESGDMNTAHTLMQQFMEAHKDEQPLPGSGRNRTQLKSVATI